MMSVYLLLLLSENSETHRLCVSDISFSSAGLIAAALHSFCQHLEQVLHVCLSPLLSNSLPNVVQLTGFTNKKI